MSSYSGPLDLLNFKVAELITVYQLVNAITCEIIDPASPNSVFGLYGKVSNEFVLGSP